MPYIGKAPSSGIRSRFIYTATAAQTTFTGADGNGKTLGYTDGEYVDVYLNGVLLDPADYTATSKTSVVLDSGATVSDIVEIVVYDTFSVFNGTFTGDLTVDGDTLFVDSTNNNVGIGTTSPNSSSTLHVKDQTDIAMSNDADGQLVLEGNGYSGAIALNATGMQIYQNSDARSLIFGNNETEQMRIDSSGNVGIGTTSPAISGTPAVTLQTKGTSSATTGLIVSSSLDGASSVNLYSGNSSSDNPAIAFQNNLRFGSATDVGVAGFAERVRILSGGGITFNGDTAAANALDDYEEGTWTPTIATGTINAGSARYTKIGNLVHVTCEVTTFSNRTSTNNVTIGGLPFSCVSDSFAISATLHRYVNTAIGGDSVLVYQGPSTTTLVPHTCKENDNYDIVHHNNLSSTSTQFYISHTYRT